MDLNGDGVEDLAVGFAGYGVYVCSGQEESLTKTRDALPDWIIGMK